MAKNIKTVLYSEEDVAKRWSEHAHLPARSSPLLRIHLLARWREAARKTSVVAMLRLKSCLKAKKWQPNMSWNTRTLTGEINPTLFGIFSLVKSSPLIHIHLPAKWQEEPREDAVVTKLRLFPSCHGNENRSHHWPSNIRVDQNRLILWRQNIAEV